MAGSRISTLRKTDFLIDDETMLNPVVKDKVLRFKPDGVIRGTGAVARDWNVQPEKVGGADSPNNIIEIPETEWSERIKELEKERALLSFIRDTAGPGKGIMPCLDQGPVSYCWTHSLVHAVMIQRAVANLPYEALSAYALAAIITNGADEGGWSPHAAELAFTMGVPTQRYWPQGDRNVRSRNTAEMKADAAKRKITEGWFDLTLREWNRHIAWRRCFSLLLAGMGCTLDLRWWGHSVYGMDPVLVEPGSYGIRILNSWGMGWGEKGTGVLRGSKAVPDLGSCSVRVTGSSMVANSRTLRRPRIRK